MESTTIWKQHNPKPQFSLKLQQSNQEIWKRLVLDILETLILAVVLYFGINAVSARVRVDGFSMNPTLQNGEYILVNKTGLQDRQATTRRHRRIHVPDEPGGGSDQKSDRPAG